MLRLQVMQQLVMCQKQTGNATKVAGGALSNLSNAVAGGLKGLGNLISGGKK